MKTNPVKLLLVVPLVAGISAFCLLPSAFGQGALTPPGAPAPTMKTLTQVEPRTLISSLPYSITNGGSYYLTTNLTGVSGTNGVSIASSDVTLDLNGFALRGVSGSLDGVRVSGTYTNITVRNGTITSWGGSGVDAYNYGTPRNLVFERLTVSLNGIAGIATQAGSVVRDCCSINNTTGISCYGGLISGCMSRDNLDTGIYAKNCTVRDCQVESNYTYGISAVHSTVRDCGAWGNGQGIHVQYGTISDCYVEYSQNSGIYYINNQNGQITGNNCYANNTNDSTNEAGIYVSGYNNRVEDNHVTASGYAGIMVNNSYNKNIIIKNTVIGSTVTNYMISTNQIVGPLITTQATITNSNPWANFSF